MSGKSNAGIMVIKRSIAIRESRLVEVQNLIDAKPLDVIIDVRKKAQEIFNKHKGDYETVAKLIDPLGKKERDALNILEKQKGQFLWDEKFKLTTEIRELNDALYRLERRW